MWVCKQNKLLEQKSRGWGDVTEAQCIIYKGLFEPTFLGAKQKQDLNLQVRKKSVECKSICSTDLTELFRRWDSVPKSFLSISLFQLGKYLGDIQISYFSLHGCLHCQVPWPCVVWGEIDTTIKETGRKLQTEGKIDHIGFVKGANRDYFYLSEINTNLWFVFEMCSTHHEHSFLLNNRDGFTIIIHVLAWLFLTDGLEL